MTVDGSGVTQPVSGTITASVTGTIPVSGTVTADTELPAAAILADGASAAPTTPTIGNIGLLMNASSVDRQRAVVNATNSVGTGIAAAGLVAQFDDAAPTAITENQFGNVRISENRNLYSTIRDAAGNERGVNVTAGNALTVDGSGTTQPVSGTVTANAGTGNFTVVQATASNLKVDLSGTAANATAINVAFGEVSAGVIADYNTASAVANGSTGTLSYTVGAGVTFYLKQIIASASGGPCKVVVDYGAGPTIICVGFFSTASPYVDFTFAQPIPIAENLDVNVKITNSAGSSQDIYGSILGLEI